MKKYWETQTGEEIEYKKLKDDHLLNILKWIEKRAESGIIEGYSYWDGDDDFQSGDYWEIYDDEVKNKYDYDGLIKETKRRKLIISKNPHN